MYRCCCWYSKHSKVTLATCKNRFVLLFCATEHCPLNFLFRRNLLNSHGKNVLSTWLNSSISANRSGSFHFLLFKLNVTFSKSIISQKLNRKSEFLIHRWSISYTSRDSEKHFSFAIIEHCSHIINSIWSTCGYTIITSMTWMMQLLSWYVLFHGWESHNFYNIHIL